MGKPFVLEKSNAADIVNELDAKLGKLDINEKEEEKKQTEQQIAQNTDQVEEQIVENKER